MLTLFAQNVNRWYQDGKVIFQLKENVKKPISNDGIVKLDQLGFLSEIISESKKSFYLNLIFDNRNLQ